jgi:hypothetical protein
MVPGKPKPMAEAIMAPAKVPEIDMDYDCDVYEPAEDTFLFLDALQDELPFLEKLDPAICVEIGYAMFASNTVKRSDHPTATCGFALGY